MAYHQQQHHHHHQDKRQTTTTTTACCCQPPLYHHPPPPPQSLTSDPFLVATLVSQLLHSQQQQQQQHNPQIPHHFYSQPIKTNQHQTHPHQETHHSQYQPHYSVFLSLLQRIDALEQSLHKLSLSSSSFSVRDAAARTIQSHFRAFLVCRSRTLRHLKDLACIKSSVILLKSCLSRHGFVDFDSVSRQAMDLFLQLDSIQGGDQMIRDSKRSITREIVQFLETVDGVCVKRHQVLTRTVKNVRLVTNDGRRSYDVRGLAERGMGTKCRNAGSNEKKLMANLRERVERIGRMSRMLDGEEEVNDAETEGFEHLDDEEDDDVIGRISSNYKLKHGVPVKKNLGGSNGKKRVCFLKDGNLSRVYDMDGSPKSISRNVDEFEESSKGRQDEEEAHSDGEQSSHSSEDRRSCTRYDQDGEFTFAAPEPVKMETRADMMTRKPGVKIVG